MKALIVISIMSLIAVCAFAQDTTTTTASLFNVRESVTIPPIPAVLPPQAIPAQPPQWIVDALTSLESFPVVGPIVSKVIQYVAIIGSFLTLLTGFLMGLIKIVGPMLATGTEAKIAADVAAVLNSKVILWLRYFSMFQKPAPVAPKTAVAPPVAS